MKNSKLEIAPFLSAAVIITLWQALSSFGVVPKFMLPSPIDVVNAFISDFWVLMEHSKVTLSEAFLGLATAIIISFVVAFLMDRFDIIKKSIFPLVILTQTIPTVAIAPLLVLWFGYDMLPKVILIVTTCFFPITVGLLVGFASADLDVIRLMKSMGASENQIFAHVKLPCALENFFAGLRISASYAIIGAVISEWLGGFNGLGVYMIRVKKSYNFDKMFAVIFLVSIISLLLMKFVDYIHKKAMPWENN
ncbi:MAG: ABC transporter permease [Clostridia bacterium]